MLVAFLPAPAAAVTGFDSQIVSTSASLNLSRGQTGQFVVTATNTGTTTWGRGTATQVDIAFCCPVTTSPFAAWNNGWLPSSHYATTTQASVAPGALANFVFNVTVPLTANDGQYPFAFEVVLASNGEPLHPEGQFVLATVQPLAANHIVVTANPSLIAASTSSTTTLRACIADAAGATITSATDSLTITNGSPSASAVTTPQTDTRSAVSGCASFSLLGSGNVGFDLFTVHDSTQAISDVNVLVQAALVKISVQVANDLNGNGVLDPGEPSTNAARIDVYAVIDGVRASAATASGVNTPNLVVQGIAAGTYDVIETNAAGFVSTNAVPGTNATKLNNDTLRMILTPGGIGTGTFLDHLRQIAYVYTTDTATRDAFASLLTARGYQVASFTVDAAATAVLSSYDAIVIGHETGSLSSWGTDAALANIRGANRPTVGLGEGGYAYFGRLGLDIGWGHGWHGSGETGVTVVDARNAIWSLPNIVPATTGATTALYSSGSTFVAIFAPDTVTSVTRIGRQVGDASHYELIAQGACYALWGFDASPSTMTTAGRDLFENFVARDGSLCGRILTACSRSRSHPDRSGTARRSPAIRPGGSSGSSTLPARTRSMYRPANSRACCSFSRGSST